MLENSGFEANVVRFSTASINGFVASAQFARFSSEKFPSRACQMEDNIIVLST